MIKTKLEKLLPYWLGLILILTILQSAGQIAAKKTQNNIKDLSQDQPEVLGAFTDVRGASDSVSPKPLNQKYAFDPNTGNLSAKSYLIYDLDSGQVLAEKNTDEKLPIASLTKLLTALVVYEKMDLNTSFTVTAADTMKIQPVLGLKAGDVVKVQDLFNAMLVGSCNDAALALANHVPVDQNEDFVGLMNQKALALGMADSLFSNPLGFDLKQNYSTAADLKKLVTVVQHLGAFKNLSKLASYSFSSAGGRFYQTKATNKLVAKYADLEAVKTGYTETAQGAMITKLDLNAHQIIIMVIGSQDREQDTLELRQELIQAYS